MWIWFVKNLYWSNDVLKSWFGWWWSSWLCFSGAHWLLLANVIGDEKPLKMKYKSVLIISILLLHGHPVHGGEPLHDLSGALVLVRVTVVLLQVDGELSDFHVIEEIPGNKHHNWGPQSAKITYSATKSRPALHSWQVYPGALLLTPQMLISWQMWVAPSMTKWLMMAN